MKKLNNSEYIKRVIKIHGQRYSILSEYISSRDEILVKCNDCYNIWETKARNLIKGCGCPSCGFKKTIKTKKWFITTDEFKDKLNPKFLCDIDIMGEYVGLKERIKVKCKICNYIWDPKAYYLKKEQGCINCSRIRNGRSSRKTHEEFVNEVNEYHNNTITVLSKYITSNQPIKYLCKLCNSKDEKPIAQRLLNRGCINCCLSKGEKKIKLLLDENNIKYKTQYSFNNLKNKNLLLFDFAIFIGDKLSHLIEYDGQHHFRPISYFGGDKRFKIQQENDKLKNKYCLRNDIKLIRIPYTEYKKIEIKHLL